MLRSARRDAVLEAFDLGPDDGARTFELGRPATGATCVLVDEPEGWVLIVPLMRTPTSARDLIPTAAAAVPLGLEGPLSVDELLALWDARHRQACRELIEMCRAQGSPPPPHLPLMELERLHGLLVERQGKPIFGVDFQEGGPVILAVADDDDAPVRGKLKDVDGQTMLFVDGAVEGLPLGRARLVTPVEIVDTESLSAD